MTDTITDTAWPHRAIDSADSVVTRLLSGQFEGGGGGRNSGWVTYVYSNMVARSRNVYTSSTKLTACYHLIYGMIRYDIRYDI